MIPLLRHSYKQFVTNCENKVVRINELLEVNISNKSNVYKLIMEHADKLNTISITYDTILNVDAIIRLQNSDFSNYRKDISSLNKKTLERYPCFKREPLILTYLSLFASYCRRERELKLYIEPFAVFAKMSFETYERLFKQLGISISEEILKGGYYSFGYKVGKLTVVRKARFFKEGTTCPNSSIDWNESYKLHDSIVERKCPELYKRYKDDKISCADYRKLSKQYVYDKELNPNGEKWHMYRLNDYECWWHWFKSFRMSNLALYRFTPTRKSNIYNYNKTLADIDISSVEKIIKHEEISNSCKLAEINKQFNTYTLRYEQI